MSETEDEALMANTLLPSDIGCTIDDTLKALRREAGLSLRKLGEIAYVHWTVIGDVERSRRNLTLHTACALDVALKTGGVLAALVRRRLMAETLLADLEDLASLARDTSTTPSPWVLPSDFDRAPVELRQPIEAALRATINKVSQRG